MATSIATNNVDQLLSSHDDLCARAKAIMVNKNHDYRGGSGDPFANFRGSSTFGIDPIVGILLRMQDKMQRIKTFAEKGQLKVKGEGIDDAIIDLINYSVLAYGLCQEERVTPSTVEESRALEQYALPFEGAAKSNAPHTGGYRRIKSEEYC